MDFAVLRILLVAFALSIRVGAGCATTTGSAATAAKPRPPAPDEPVGHPSRKGEPQPVFEFEPGPAVADHHELSAWLEANRGRRLLLPVVIERGAVGSARRTFVGALELLTTDLALGVPLDERVAHRCGREARRCALWLEGRYGEPPHIPDDRPQFEVLKVGDVVAETNELRAHRAR